MACKTVDISTNNNLAYSGQYVGCIILTNDKRIMLQLRGLDWDRYPGYLCEFGGRIEANETPMQALIRELREETGATVNENEVVSLGAITEDLSKHTELLYVYFWHDKEGTITGCYEGEAKYFDNLNDIIKYPKIMDSVNWLLNACQTKKLLK